ncbi:Glycosyltransferase, catalytic subunit of cellulose synthase and poly-beta-1,6-N-acetylglucosamine synthase [Ekhidna lutea]|uniref:Glycosyltransferase, catalytic subunit of cellulose synthase and poly-beta-1,6-N-acetylglucosamine synthase n=2 Tax=Ekhidna lutea TaxID=447679 RepID=A0A239HJL8_EKHLU|nr:Glycosyltransferase, catalytic subunit of cellulose synthase and poly-beta-1,6-N-acetylglucosamine synthase [Ekhidna lutea]
MILITAFTLLHVLFYLRLAQGWRKIPVVEKSGNKISFSVIIPVRNEATNIQTILKNLESQHYPKELFEVIVIDDFSEDDTAQIVNQLIPSLNLNLRLVQLSDPTKQGKKHALTAGVKAAKYETILTTDADCWFGESWIRSYSDAFGKEVNMVAGPVAIEGRGIFARLQQVEFAGLIGFGAVTISEENPSMCSGANLGFKKAAFEEVGGYTDNLFTPSGDDEFLLFNIMRKFPHSTIFLQSKEAVVCTPAHSKLRSFVNQRTRWTSKWKYNKNWKVRISAILFFLDYLIFYGAIAGAILGIVDDVFITGIAIMRFLVLLFFVSPVNRFMGGRSSFFPLLLFQIIYPLHVLFMGMNSIFGSYTWKGRKYG